MNKLLLILCFLSINSFGFIPWPISAGSSVAGSSLIRLEAVEVNNTCSGVVRQTTSGYSVSNTASGGYNLLFASGMWSGPPMCVCSPQSDGYRCTIHTIPSTTSTTIQIVDGGGTGHNDESWVICVGPRQQ